MASWDVDEAQRCGWWIVWQILVPYDLTLTVWNLVRGKRLIWVVFSVFLGVWWGPLGSSTGDMASWDVVEAWGCGWWIFWQILGPYDLTLTAWNLARGKRLIWVVFSVLLGVWWGPLGSRLGDMASWDVDEARGCGWWIFWQILGPYDLTLSMVQKKLNVWQFLHFVSMYRQYCCYSSCRDTCFSLFSSYCWCCWSWRYCSRSCDKSKLFFVVVIPVVVVCKNGCSILPIL